MQKENHTETALNERARENDDKSAGAARPAKKAKKTTQFRAWATDPSSPGPLYKLECVFGDPSKPLPGFIKSAKKPFLQQLLRERNLDTTGSKAVLLERCQKERPKVILEIDGRECLQRVVNSFLTYFEWDNSHLFTMQLPRRGTNQEGCVPVWEEIFELKMMYRPYFEQYGSNLADWPMDQRSKNRLVKTRLHNGKYTMEQLRSALENGSPMGPLRKLSGSAFDPLQASYDYENMEPTGPQGSYSLQELAVEKGDVLNIVYDHGDEHVFTVNVLEVSSGVLAEQVVASHPTRVRLVEKGPARIPPQY